MLGIHQDEGFADIADAQAGDGLGGLVIKTWGSTGIFFVSAGLMLLWMALAWPMRAASRS